jgi:hypothetical protein
MTESSRIGSLEADRQTLEALRNAGADLSKPTHVLYYLYFPTQDVAARAQLSGTTPELPATVRPAASGGGWLVLFEGSLVPSESTIHGHTKRLSALAGSLGGEYDGWEAKITR